MEWEIGGEGSKGVEKENKQGKGDELEGWRKKMNKNKDNKIKENEWREKKGTEGTKRIKEMGGRCDEEKRSMWRRGKESKRKDERDMKEGERRRKNDVQRNAWTVKEERSDIVNWN